MSGQKPESQAARELSQMLSAMPGATTPARDIVLGLKNDLVTLEYKARCGEKEAAQEYLQLANGLVDGLQRITLGQFDMTRELARRCSRWPVFHHMHPELTERAARLIPELQLGEATPLKMPAKSRPWSVSNRANAEVILQLQVIDSYRGEATPYSDEHSESLRQLPDLSAETAEQWWGAVWGHIMHITNDHPESNLELRPLGISRESKYDRLTKPTGVRAKASERTKRTRESNIRDGIRLALKNAFFRVVKSSLRKRPSK